VPKGEKETPADYEARTWRERMHCDEKGMIFIPGLQLKRALDGAACFLDIKIPGHGSSKYKKHIIAGVMVFDNIALGIHKDSIQGETLLVPSDGRKGGGGGKSVEKTFGIITEWAGELAFYIFDDTVTKDVFEKHLSEAGKFIGIGRFRPQNGGFYGRFIVDKVKWDEKEN
jgi:hypothetical protein